MAAARIDQILALLRERGGRVTSPRRAILSALLESDSHVTAEDLAATVQRRHPDVHRSTIYRCLDTLTELGVVDHVHLGHGPAVYHVTDRPHHHLVCDGCGLVTGIPFEIFGTASKRIERDFGFRLGGTHFALTGLCAACTDS